MFFEKKHPQAPKCYAHLIGGCSGPMSGEHAFTESVMGKGGTIHVRGFKNRPDREIGMASAVSNILCQKHNSVLGVLDEEAKKLSDAMVDFANGTSAGLVSLDGPTFERWLLKVTLGYLAAGHTQLGRLYPRRPEIVQALYGQVPIPPPLGLSSIVGTGRWVDYPREHLFRELVAIDPTGKSRCVGAFVALHGVPFLLSLGGPFPVADYLRKPDGSSYLDPYDCSKASARFHPTSIRLSSDEVPDLVVEIAWPDIRNNAQIG